MTEYDTVLYALSFAPAAARPGEIVHLRFRARNVSRAPSPAGTIEFLIGDGLDAIGDVVVDVAPVAAGEDVCAEVAARVASGADDGTSLAAQAVLRCDDDAIGTNVARLTVRTQPVLDGPASGTFVDALGDDLILVRAVVTNEGDGPARALRLRLAAPHGCTRTDGDGPATLAHDRLEPGESLSLAMTARIVAPAGTIEASDAAVAAGDARFRLRARSGIAAQADLAPPVVTVSVARRRASLTIELRNAGWADACDVPLSIELPPGLRPVRDEITLDGIPLETRAARKGDGDAVGRLAIAGSRCDVVAACIPARTTARIELAAAYAAPCESGTVRVTQGTRSADASFTPHAVRDLRLRIEDAPAVAAPTDAVAFTAVLLNAGDRAESVTLRGSGELAFQPVAVAVSAGRSTRVALRAPLPDGCEDDALVEFALVAVDGDGDECVRAAATIVVRDRAWLVLDGPVVCEGDTARYAVRNDGPAPARDAVLTAGSTTRALGSIPAGESVVIEIATSEAVAGGFVRARNAPELRLAAVAGGAAPPPVHATLDVPDAVAAGAAFDVRLVLEVDVAIEMLTIRAETPAGTAYVAGSTAIDGCRAVDPAGGSPLRGGLVLHALPSRSHLAVSWSLVADPSGDCDGARAEAAIDAGGVVQTLVSAPVAFRPGGAFATRAADLPYHVTSCALDARRAEPLGAAPEPIEPPEPPERRPPDAEVAIDTLDAEDAVVLALPLGGDELDDAARLLRAGDARGLASHALALRALFPSVARCGDRDAAEALHDARTALADVFDRLYVKLRIPGFDATADDLEDASLRRAMLALLERLLAAEPGEVGERTLCVSIDRTALRALLDELASAALGAPQMLRVLTALVPTRCDDEPLLAATLVRYVRALDDAFARCADLPREAFDRTLAGGRDTALDDARGALGAALRARTALAAVGW
ncbi:MAG: hypothetical protein JWO85_3571 [Candidatus Eremiobacteraeota bacterium]|nr:hypothetical protein [Candidatus Eremiobacteraeota bacterium]